LIDTHTRFIYIGCRWK